MYSILRTAIYLGDALFKVGKFISVKSVEACDDMTSVAVSPDGKTLAVAMQDEDYRKHGCMLFFDCGEDGSLAYSGIAAVGAAVSGRKKKSVK